MATSTTPQTHTAEPPEIPPPAWTLTEGPAIHHFGIEVDDRRKFIEKIAANGGTLLSKPDSGTVKFRAPDGTIAEIVDVGRYERMRDGRS